MCVELALFWLFETGILKMKNQTVIGIGCFAKPERLRLIFNKFVQDYALGSVEDDQLFDHNIPAGCEKADLLRALTSKFTGSRPSGGCNNLEFQEKQIITGFYLSLLGRKLNLKIFARGNNSRQAIYSATLDGLAKLRQKRLN
jgi:hypothetical protein